MSGSNGVQRWAKVNREDELVPLKSRGSTMYAFQFQSISTTTIVPGSNPPVSTNPNPTTLTPAQMFQNLTFDAGTINPISAPAFSLVATELANRGLLELGYSWTVYYQNTNPPSGNIFSPPPNGSVTITFPASWSISGLVVNALTIQPGETVPVTYIISSLGPPVTVRLMTGAPLSSGGRNPYAFDKSVIIRPSNVDGTLPPASVIYDFPLVDGQPMTQLISYGAPFSLAGGLVNAMLYMRENDAAAPANLSNYWIVCSPGTLVAPAANFAVRMDGQAFGTAFNIVSTSTVKTDIVPITSSLAEGYQMLPYQYRYVWDAPGTQRFGFIADQINDFPTLVPATPDNEAVDLYAVLAVHQQMIRDLNTRIINLIAELKAAPNNLVLP